MFQSAGLTTNNHAEAYNSRLGKSKLGKHPNFYLWTDSIISELKNASVEAAMALEDITVPAEYRPTLAVLPSEPDQMSSSNVSTFIPQTPAITDEQSYRRVQGLKRRSDISHSVSGANLRKKR